MQKSRFRRLLAFSFPAQKSRFRRLLAFSFTAHVSKLTQCTLTAPSVDCGDTFTQEQMYTSVIKLEINPNSCCGVKAMKRDIHICLLCAQNSTDFLVHYFEWNAGVAEDSGIKHNPTSTFSDERIHSIVDKPS